MSSRARRGQAENGEMKGVGPSTHDDGGFIRAFALAWGVGGFAVALVEFLTTGENLLDSGGSWLSWLAGASASIVTFAAVLFWWRRKSPPTD